jgi:hypothetical protein
MNRSTRELALGLLILFIVNPLIAATSGATAQAEEFFNGSYRFTFSR